MKKTARLPNIVATSINEGNLEATNSNFKLDLVPTFYWI